MHQEKFGVSGLHALQELVFQKKTPYITMSSAWLPKGGEGGAAAGVLLPSERKALQ